MSHKQSNPGCACCCPDCSKFYEASDPAWNLDDWDQVSGTWSIVNSRLRTSSNNALIVHKGTATTTAWRVAFEMGSIDVGEWIRFVFAYADADNYCYLRFSRAAPSGGISVYTFEIYERIAGSETKLWDDTANWSSLLGLIPFYICYDQGTITVEEPLDTSPGVNDLGVITSFAASDATALGTRAGFGTETISGGVSSWEEFDDLELWPLKTGCPDCWITLFDFGERVDQIQLTIAGATNGWCDDCAQLNGVWMLDRFRYGNTYRSPKIDFNCTGYYAFSAYIWLTIGRYINLITGVTETRVKLDITYSATTASTKMADAVVPDTCGLIKAASLDGLQLTPTADDLNGICNEYPSATFTLAIP